MYLEIFDVEHGACALLTADNYARLMIDCASSTTNNWSPARHFRSVGVNHLEMLAITNYDEDHVRGLPDLRHQVTIGSLWRNRSVTPQLIKALKSEDGMGPGIEELTRMANEYCAEGQLPFLQGVTDLRAFSATYPRFDDENNLSLAVTVKLNQLRFLFPGDLETAGWEHLLEGAEFREVVRDTSVLIASHHGRENGICADLFDRHGCNPEIIVISDKGHMHETQNTVNYYRTKVRSAPFRGNQRHVLTTRSDGHITFEVTPTSARVY